MSISYLSKPNVPSVTPYQEPIQYILQAAQIKQNKYDKVLDIISNKENALLSIDTRWASNEITDKKDNMLKKMEADLNATVKLDLLNPDNIKKVDNLFKPIVNDKEIQYAASFTKMQNESFATYDKWRESKPELYNPGNEAYTLKLASRNKKMSAKDFMMSGQVAQAIEYVDNQKLMRDSVDKLPPDVVKTSSSDGKGWIYKQGNKYLSYTDILAMLPNSDKSLAQAAVDADREYANSTPGELLGHQRRFITEEKSSYISNNIDIETTNKTLMTTIKDLLSDSAESKAYLKKNYGSDDEKTKATVLEKLQKEIETNKLQFDSNKKVIDRYDTSLNEFDNIYGATPDGKGGFTFAKQLTDREFDGLKTQVFWRNQKDQFAKAWSYRETTFEIEQDPYYKSDYEFAHQMQEIEFRALMDAKKEALTGGKNSSKSITNAENDEEGTPLGAGFQSLPASVKQDEEKFSDSQSMESKIWQQAQEVGLTKSLTTGLYESKPESGTLYKNYKQIASKSLFGETEKTLTNEQFNQKIADYKKVQVLWDKEIEKDGNKKIPGKGELTYNKYFNNDPANKVIGEYITQYDLKRNELDNWSNFYTSIRKNAWAEAEGTSGAKFNKDLLISPTSPVNPGTPDNLMFNPGSGLSESINTVYGIKVPQKYSRAFLDKNLSISQLQDIFKSNPGFSGTFDDFHKMYRGNYYTNDPKINEYKRISEGIINSDVSKVSVSPVGKPLTFTDLNINKSAGTTAMANAKKYIQNMVATDGVTPPTYENIEVVGLVPTKDGRGYNFSWKVKKLGPDGLPADEIQTPIAVSEDYIRDNNVPTPNVFNIEKILNAKYKFNTSVRGMSGPVDYNFNFNGKKYVFQQHGDGQYSLKERRADGVLVTPDDLPNLPDFGGYNIPSIEGGYDYIVSSGHPAFKKASKEAQALQDWFDDYNKKYNIK